MADQEPVQARGFEGQKREPDLDRPAQNPAENSAESYARKWLDEHGAALEMQVASKFLLSPSRVEHSGYYRDVREGVLREFDVHATFFKNSAAGAADFTIDVVAECKASSAPWILYMASDPYGALDWDFEDFFVVTARPSATVRDLHGFPFAPAFRTAGSPHAYQVAEAGKKNAAPFDAVRQVLDAVAGLSAAHALEGNGPRVRLYVPLVVTTSPMFEARLGATGDIELAETDLAPFFAKRLGSDSGAGVSTRLVWIVRDTAVDQLVGKVLDSLNTMSL